MKTYRATNDAGYTLLGVLVMTTLGLVLAGGMLDTAASNARTRALVQTRANYYYQVEETLNKTVGWLQLNSKYLVSAFEEANFNDNFDLGSPTLGTNEGQHFSVPTMVKMKGTNNSVMLSNNDFFGVPAFPSLTHVDSGSSLNAIQAFQNADLGEANARVILVWARESDGDYEPIFRIDVVTGNNPDRGVHTFSYVYSTIVSSTGGTGFYGKNWLDLNTPNNVCVSYQYSFSGNAWSKGAPRANCHIASDGPIDISSKVQGTAQTLQEDGVNYNPPGGNVSGDVCEGPHCHSYTLPPVQPWASSCPTHNGPVNVPSKSSHPLPSGDCYEDAYIPNQSKLQLTDTENPYYFKSIDFGGAHANLDLGVLPPGEKVQIYVEEFDGNTLNGNRLINNSNAPHQLEIYYVGSEELTFNGTSQINAVVYAPNAKVNVLGNFNFYGGILAKELYVGGNSTVNYDEMMGSTPVFSDLNFALRKASQRYR